MPTKPTYADLEQRIADLEQTVARQTLAERVLREMVDQIPFPVYAKNAEGRFLFTNRVVADNLGLRVDEVVGKLQRDLHLDKDELAAMLADDRKVIESKQMLVIPEEKYTTGDGTISWWQTIKLPFKSIASDEVVLLGVSVDITKRKRVEDALRESEEKYRELVDLAQEGIWVINKDNDTSFVNPSMARMLGYAPEEMAGKPLFAFMDEQGIAVAEANLERRRQGVKEQHDFEFISKAGDRLYTTIETAPILDEEGNYNGAIAGIIDITERKQAEKALKESEARLNAFLENSPVGLGIWDKKLRYVFVNEVLQKMNGPSLEDHIGHTVEEVLPHVAHIVRPMFEQILATGEPLLNLELSGEIPSTPGAVIHCLVSYFPIIGADGSPQFIGGVIMDITHRVLAERELQKERALLSAIIDDIPVLLTRYDPRANMLYLNKEFEKSVGWSTEDVKTVDLMEQVYPEPDYRQAAIAYMQSATADWKEFRVRSRDGEIIDSEWSNITLEDGTHIGIGIDITERKRAETELEKNRIILSEAEKIAGLGAWEWDIAKDVWTMSDNWLLIHGGVRPQMTTAELMPFAHPDDNLAIEAALARAVASEEPYEIEHRIVHGNTGEVRIIQAYGEVRHDRSGLAVKMYGTARDITEQKLARKALQESEARYRALVEFSSEHIFMLSPEGAYLASNDRVDKFKVDKGRSLVGSHLEDVYPPEIATVYRQHLERVLDTGQATQFEHSLPQKSGSEYHLDTLYPIIGDDRVFAVGGICRDITELKMLDFQLRQARKMETIGTLAGGIAHDFNNILYMITGNAELALEEIPDWNPIHENLQEIKNAGLRAAGIVRQLLNFSRKTEQDLRPIGAVTVIKEALKFIRSTIPATIGIQSSLPQQEITILGDPVLINQALINICTNAFQVMEETGGVLEITAARIRLGEEAQTLNPDFEAGHYLRIVIRDTGPGIDPEIKEHIFDPYFTTKDVGKGTGMGLAVVHGIVNNHGGAITIDTRPGAGAAFTIHFPVVPEKVAVTPEEADITPGGTESILFVDDEPSIGKMVGRMLQQLGYRVRTLTNPFELLKLFRSQPADFDLVITDMTMPQMTGASLSAKLLETRPDIPVVICTGHSSLINEEKAKVLGLAALITKPIRRRDLAQTIRCVLDGAKPAKLT